MKKNLIPILIAIFLVCIFGGMAYLSFYENQISSNPPGTIGNTAGNLNNGGLFCEQNGVVYFSNPLDNGCLYSMNSDETNLQKLYDGNVCNILTGGDYLYYFMREPNSTSLGNLRVSHAFYRSKLNGTEVKTMTTDVVINSQLVNDSLFLMTQTNSGLSFYRMNTDRSEKTELADYSVNPACASDGTIYYNGTRTNHYLYALDTQTNISSIFWKGNIWHPILEGNYIYYLDVENDYRLCRYNYNEKVIEVLTHERVECYNIGSGYIYYQNNSQTEPALKRMTLSGEDVTVIAKGNYTALHMTSDYLYFKEFGNDAFWYHSPIGSNTYSSM